MIDGKILGDVPIGRRMCVSRTPGLEKKNKTLFQHRNSQLLNCKEVDARVTMQEIIEGYPFVDCHKELVINESI
jgi:hypothetical protein